MTVKFRVLTMKVAKANASSESASFSRPVNLGSPPTFLVLIASQLDKQFGTRWRVVLTPTGGDCFSIHSFFRIPMRVLFE